MEKFKHEQQKARVKPRVTLHSTCNTHACTLSPHSKNNMWMPCGKIEDKQQQIHRQVTCDTTFHMKCTYLHIIFTQHEYYAWMYVKKFKH